ncbi:hypothetical protein C8F04DRAFT_1183833 [Mycena alexandri]|uniref:Uncharacterized protein n=1 Tax=Mycena alexandri TaxID=1745969 RepID=A0AAD6X025_9AGAR|nr:hypothetical protein C8F04DRAFT_1183833 [Mycena alexandri]
MKLTLGAITVEGISQLPARKTRHVGTVTRAGSGTAPMPGAECPGGMRRSINGLCPAPSHVGILWHLPAQYTADDNFERRLGGLRNGESSPTAGPTWNSFDRKLNTYYTHIASYFPLGCDECCPKSGHPIQGDIHQLGGESSSKGDRISPVRIIQGDCAVGVIALQSRSQVQRRIKFEVALGNQVRRNELRDNIPVSSPGMRVWRMVVFRRGGDVASAAHDDRCGRPPEEPAQWARGKQRVFCAGYAPKVPNIYRDIGRMVGI